MSSDIAMILHILQPTATREDGSHCRDDQVNSPITQVVIVLCT
jgi:hypothetical protein